MSSGYNISTTLCCSFRNTFAPDTSLTLNPAQDAAKRINPMKLLIADDNTQITSILEEYAKKEGYRTVIAHDGEEALRLFAREKPDVVLLDVMMPIKDGFSVCREIRKE
ncbi:MAG: response regulator, partial [Clostridiales bacterium]|nr:response regulator [Clostridiales bacterium]